MLAHNSCNLAPLRDLLGNNQLWADFAANLKTLNSSLTKAERQAFYGKLNDVFTGDKVKLTKFIENFNAGDDAFKTLVIKEPDLINKALSTSGIQFLNFLSKTLAQKLDIITTAWTSLYPQIYIDRSMFEHIMGRYRYLRSAGWGHTADIASNFKAVDFYNNFSINGNVIRAETAVSMKTTTTTSVDAWKSTQAVRDNILNLEQGLINGIGGNGTTLNYSKAEIHIYMKEVNITQELKNDWISTLSKAHPNIKFQINSLEDFVK